MKRHRQHVRGASDPGRVENYQPTSYIPSAVSGSDAGNKHNLVVTRALVDFGYKPYSGGVVSWRDTMFA